MTLQLGILLALGCAVATNLGFFYKHRGACAAPPVDIKHPLRSAKALYSSPWFALGMFVATAAWGLHVAALALAPMSVVQAVLAGGVVLLAAMVAFETGLFGIGGLLILGPRVGAPEHHHGVMLGAASGVLFGVSDVSI